MINENPLYTNAVCFLMEILFPTNTCNKKYNQMQTYPEPCFQTAQFLTYYRPKWLACEQALARVPGWGRKEKSPGQPNPQGISPGHFSLALEVGSKAREKFPEEEVSNRVPCRAYLQATDWLKSILNCTPKGLKIPYILVPHL